MSTTLLSLALLSVLAPPVEVSEKPETLLFVRTTPAGAKVFLDGKPLGTTDDLFSVKPGVRRIVIELEGHDPQSKEVTIRAGEITRLVLEFKKALQEAGDRTGSDGKGIGGTGVELWRGETGTFRVEIKSTWAWNRTLTFNGDGTYVFTMQTFEQVPGERHLQPSKTPYVASYRLSPGSLLEMTRLLKATGWLSLAAGTQPALKDATEYGMTLSRDGKTLRRTYRQGDKVQAYEDLVRFLRRIERQEELLYSVTHRGKPSTSGNSLGGELDAMMGVGSRTRPYAPVLDYHRLVSAYGKFLLNPKPSPRLAIGAAKLMGYLKLESQRKNLEAVAMGRVVADPSYSVPTEVRKAAVEALGLMGAGQSIEALKTAAGDGDSWLRDAVAEALLTARADKAVPILKDLAGRSQNAAWALIRLGPTTSCFFLPDL